MAVVQAKGIKASRIINHDDSPMQASLEMTPSTFVRSIYFFDPNGILNPGKVIDAVIAP